MLDFRIGTTSPYHRKIENVHHQKWKGWEGICSVSRKICLLGTDFGGGWVCRGGLDSCRNRKERYHECFKRIFTNTKLVIDISNIIIVKWSAECNYICTWNPNDLYFWRSTPQNKAELSIKTRGPIWVPGMQGNANWTFTKTGPCLIGPCQDLSRDPNAPTSWTTSSVSSPRFAKNRDEGMTPAFHRRLLKTEGSYETTWPWAPLRIHGTNGIFTYIYLDFIGL